MLQDLIKDLQSSLKSYSQGLAKQNVLVDIPWTLIEGDFSTKRLIFKKNGVLRTINEGLIEETTWEYEQSLDSLILQIGSQKFLMKEVYLDGCVLILKRDGLNLDFLAFADERVIPDLDIVKYLKTVDKIPIQKISASKKTNQEPDQALVALVVLALIFFFIFLIIENFK